MSSEFNIIFEKTAAFSGHRPHAFGGYDESNPQILAVKNLLKGEIDAALARGIDTFISGGAIGVDTWSAEIVLELKANLVVAKPFPSQYQRWPRAVIERYFAFIKKAKLVVDVSIDPYCVWKMHKRNCWMVDRAETLIAVFNGTPGGTANCVEYAKSLNRNIRLIVP